MAWKFLVLMMSLSGCVYTEFPQEPPAANNLPGTPVPDDTLDDGLAGEFLLGQFLFEREWSPEEVGPVFNASSCGECHGSAGRAPAASVGLLFRLSAAPEAVTQITATLIKHTRIDNLAARSCEQLDERLGVNQMRNGPHRSVAKSHLETAVMRSAH